MDMKLDVPLIRQEKDTHVCVLASLSMILQYHGWDVSIADLERDEDAREADLGAVGTYLLKHGFDAEVVMFHPRLFTLRDRGMSEAALAEHFQARIGHDDNMQWDDDVLRSLIGFLGHGGAVTVEIPGEDHIREEIKAKRPLLVTTDTNFLYGEQAQYYLHANVITGIDDEYIYVNDPLWDERGGRRRHERKDYMFGIYMATHGNFNNGYLLKVKPR